jgi:hypothetical protein
VTRPHREGARTRAWAGSRGHGARPRQAGWENGGGPFLFSSFSYFLLFLFRFIHKKELQIKWINNKTICQTENRCIPI